MKSPYMRNDRSTRLDFKDKLKKRIEIKLKEEVKDASKQGDNK